MTKPALNFGRVGTLSTVDGGLIDFLQTLRDGVSVVDGNQRVVFFNEAYLHQFELSSDDIRIGDHLDKAMLLLAKRGMLGAPPDQSAEDVVADRMESWGSEASRIERRVLTSGRVLDIYRTPTIDDNLISIHVDVTESVRNAEELERQRHYMEVLLDNTNDGFTLLDGEGRFVMFNDRVLELYDIEKTSVFWGMPYRDFARQFGDLQGLTQEERDAEIDKRYSFAFDPDIVSVNRRLNDGRTINVAKRNLASGGCVMTYRDMTAQLAREEELVEARHAAEESSRHKSEFVARMSHEMRTPLNGILGIAALMQQTSMDKRQAELVNVISTSGKVLLRLIDDILDLSRIDAETFEVVEDQFDIFHVLRESIGLIEPSANEKGLDVRLELPDERIPKLKGDMVRIKQILLNLMTNAVKFTDFGYIAVRLSTEPEPDGLTLIFDVMDTGVGIAGDQLDQIFNRFYQIDGTVTRKYGGAGLGLSITQKLVDAMGGTIQVTSEVGRGTTFRINLTLPYAVRPRRKASNS
ncbi:MAG: PAS-domain containing protein [Pseudomonadota bacterium]